MGIIESKLKAKNSIQSELQEAKDEVELKIQDRLEDNGISVCEVDSSSEALEFTVTTDRMLEREQLSDLDSYFENFCCSAISTEIDERNERAVARLFFNNSDR